MSTSAGSRDYGRFDELAEEFAGRLRRGERPEVEDYVDRLPEMAEEIREMFPAMAEVERADEAARWEAAPTSAVAPPPGRVGDYRIVREIGRGGMGVVYEAEQVSLGRRVALKVFPCHARGDPRSLERFRREAKAAARLHHTNIVPVHEVGQEGDVSFYAMQLIQGQALEQVIDQLARLGEPLSVHPAIGEPGESVVSSVDPSGRRRTYCRGVAQIGRQAAQGLAHAHSRGVVHRDIKPSNLLLDTDGVVWITDFGLAKAGDDGLTATGDVLGTLRYMAPERFRGEGDARADVYALGLTLYELLTLRPAFATSDRLDLSERIRSQEPARPRSIDRRIPRDLETIVLKAIEKDPKRRYASADAMAEDLRRFLDDEPIQARRVSAAERYARWARRHPAIAILGAVLTAVLVLTTLGSVVVAGRMARLAEDEREARSSAQGETYRAVLSEARALRVGHPPGWREEALGDLSRLALMPTSRRDLPELRTEAAAALGTPDIRLAARVELRPGDLGSFAFSPDGRTLLTAGLETGLDFWDVPGGRHLSSAVGLTVGVSRFDTAVFLPDGRGLAIGTRDRGVVFADARGRATDRAPISVGASRPGGLAISGDGRRIAVAWADGGGITVHDAADGVLLDRFEDDPVANGPDGPIIRPFALSPDGRWLARPEGPDIVLRPIASGGARVVLGRHGGAYALAFRPDGSMLATAFRDHTTVLWDLASRQRYATLRGHHERVIDVAFSPDGEWIATGSLDYTTRIWETRTGQVVATLPGPGPTLRVRWSPGGQSLATSTNDHREVFLYGIAGRHDVQRWLTGHRVELRCVAARPRRGRIATSGYSELNGWDLDAPRPGPVAMERNPGAVTAMAYSPDGSLLATTSWLLGPPAVREVSIRDGETGEVRSRIPMPHIVNAMAFDPAGGRLACGDMAGEVVLWDLATARPLRRFATGSAVWSIVFLERPRRLVTHGRDAVLLLDPDSGRVEQEVALAGGGIRMLAADRGRTRLVVGSQGGAIAGLSLPDLIRGRCLEAAHDGSADCLALSPDGTLLATGGADRRVVLRDARSFETLLEFPTWAGNLRDLTFDIEGRRLIVVGTDCDADVWDLTALHDGLTRIGLAWDRRLATGPAPAGDRPPPEVPVLRRPAPPIAPTGTGK